MPLRKTTVVIAAALASLVATAPDAGAADENTAKKDTTKKTWTVEASHGSYSETIPLQLPGFRGITPTLALVYDSSSGNGDVGVGFRLSGASVIERASTGKGAPNYDGDDVFLLDGEELVACAAYASPSCRAGGTHMAKVESFERIAFSGAGAESTWTITAKDGTRRVFAPIQLNGGDVFAWGLSEVIDTSDNVVRYGWWSDDLGVRLDSITYGGVSVDLHYEERSDEELSAMGKGAMRVSRGRLKTIDVRAGGDRVRAYELSYVTSSATSRSLLSSVRQLGRDATVDASGTVTGGTSLPPITMHYQGAAPAFSEGSHDVALSLGSGAHNFAIDIDGDGKTDMLEIDATLGVAWRRTWISDGSGFIETSDELGMSGSTNARFLPADVDGDGKVDVIELYPAGLTWGRRTWISNGTGFDEASNEPASAIYDADSQFFPMDVDGDGKTDLLELRPVFGAYRRVVWRSDGTDFTAISEEGGIAYDADARFYPMDVNGDGKSDLVELSTGWGTPWGTWGRRVWMSDGSRFVAGAQDFIARNADDQFLPMDINGDGKTDLTQIHPVLSASVRKAWLSTGDAFVLGSEQPGALFSGDNWYVAIDVNGDGRSDLMEIDNHGLGLFGRRMWLSTGSDFLPGAYDTDMGFHPDTEILAADIDGDGLSEIVQVYPASIARGRRVWSMGSGGYPDLLTSMTNRLGGTTSIEYTPSSAWTNANNPPLLQTVSKVTTSDGRGDASSTHYAYSGGLFDRAERRFWGFRTQRETLPCVTGEAACPYSETWFRQDPAAASKPERVELRDGAGVLLRSRRYEYTTHGDAIPWTSHASGEWEQTHAGGGEACPGAECKRKYTSRTFDDHGEVIVEVDHGDYDVEGDEVTTETTFVPNLTAYIVNKPARIRVLEGTRLDGVVLEETRALYDGASAWDEAPSVGRETTSARWLSTTDTFVATHKEYDAPGNVVAEVDAVGARTEYTYDAQHQLYPETVRNPLGQETKLTWDFVCGAPTGLDDRNGQRTTFAYDALCRMSERTDPGGMFERHTWIDLGAADRQHELVERPSADGSGQPHWTRIYFDGKQRIRRSTERAADGALDVDGLGIRYGGERGEEDASVAQANDEADDDAARSTGDRAARGAVQEDGPLAMFARVLGGAVDPTGSPRGADVQGRTWRTVARGPDDATGDIYVDVGYSGRDLVASVTAPYYWRANTEAPATYVTTVRYDAMDRPTVLTRPDGAQTTRSYHLWSVTEVDELGHDEVDETDADGRRVSHGERIGGEIATTSYVYDARGHLSTSTDPAGNVTVHEHDSLGRLVRLTDLDRGTETFEYDAAGRLVARTDNMKQRTELGYDALGRKTRKTSLAGTDGAVTVSWTYDEAREGSFNVGHLTTKTDPAGSERFDHDAAGNVVRTVRTIHGDVYAHEHGFDAGNRRLWTTFPDGGTLGTREAPLTYDGAGRLRAIPGYVADVRHTADGQVSRLENTNGTVTTRRYAAERGWLVAIETISSDGSTIQDLGYLRDAKGRIVEVESPFEGEAWTYAYDERDRLIAAKSASNPEEDQTLAYDAIGNITHNSQVGAYVYGGRQPHAVTRAGETAYAYDDNGQMISGASRVLTWDGDNRLASVTFEPSRFAVGNDARQNETHAGCDVATGRTSPWTMVLLAPIALFLRRLASAGRRMARRAAPAACTGVLALAAAGCTDAESQGPPGAEGESLEERTLTFTYDADDARIQQVDRDLTTRYLGDDYEIEVGGPSHRSVLVGDIVVARSDGKTTTWVHTDHLGSIQAETDASGEEVRRKTYRPHGDVSSSEGTARDDARGYIAQRHDLSGLLYLHARYYDPELGRFISPDSIISGTDTIGLNRYAYGDNDPINKKDVNGHWAALAVIGGAVITVVGLTADVISIYSFVETHSTEVIQGTPVADPDPEPEQPKPTGPKQIGKGGAGKSFPDGPKAPGGSAPEPPGGGKGDDPPR